MKTITSMVFIEYYVYFTTGLAVLMAFGLLVRKLNFRTAHLMAILLGFSYLQLAAYYIVSDTPELIMRFLVPPPAITVSFGPLIYFYVSSFTEGKQRYTRRDLLHYLPVLVVFIFSLHFIFLSPEMKVEYLRSKFTKFSEFTILILASIGIFVGYVICQIIKIKCFFLKENPVHKRIIKIFVVFASWFVFLICKIFGMRFGNEILVSISTVGFASQVIILYFALQKMPFLMNYGVICCQGGEHTPGSKHCSNDEPRKKTRSYLDNIDIENLQQQLHFVMEEEKLYCDEDLSLMRLSRALDITPHQLSEFLNEHYGKNFNTFVNTYRIDYACTLLKENPESSTLSVAFASGFNSYSAFYSAFKKAVGSSPGNYKSSTLKTQ